MGAVRVGRHDRPDRADDRRPARGAQPPGPTLDPGHCRDPDPDRASVAGFLIHLVVGRVFALGYAACLALLGQATWWIGGLLGILHGAITLTVIIPLLVGVHPRMASNRAGPGSSAVLEPPGLLGLNYGAQTPLVTLVAHLAYGIALGLLLNAH